MFLPLLTRWGVGGGRNEAQIQFLTSVLDLGVEKQPPGSSNRGLGGPQSQSVRFEKIKIYYPYRESKHASSLAHPIGSYPGY